MTPLTSQSAAQAFRTALALFEAGVDLMRQNIKRYCVTRIATSVRRCCVPTVEASSMM
jgi:hypothetical protein